MKTMKTAAMLMATAILMTGCMSTQSNSTGYGADAMGRTIPERISDGSIELTARRNLSTIVGVNGNNVRIAIDGFRREVLLTGEVPSETIKMEVERTIASMKDVTKVYNYLTVVETPKSQSHTVHENYLRSKIVSRLIAKRGGIKSSQYKIIVRDRTAYVMGYMTPAQQNQVLEAIQATSGMAMAVTLTTLVNEMEVGSEPMMSEPPMNNGADNLSSTAVETSTNSGAGYELQEIYLPDANSQAPESIAPVVMGGV